MHQIRDWLYIGNYRDTRNLADLQARHIGAMLQLAELVKQPGIATLYLAVVDGKPLPEDLLQKGIAFVQEQKTAGKSVLISCGAGISRSSTYVIAVLMAEEGLDFFEAYRSVVTYHPDALPHPELCQSLLAYHGIDIGLVELWERIFAIRKEINTSE